ncbi:diguanylate cyclase domain-containing protein [Alteromonas sp. A081]|uniref:diguanylate cyclase domain-containing protein n=1 Tax=Alteromonas sp. A081 TaxID=3410269 RepID=UPI003B97E8E0
MVSHLTRHQGLFLLSFILPLMAFSLCVLAGTYEQSGIEWLDVLGEGSVSLVLLLWVLALLISRPSGKLTHLLVIGLNLILFSSLLDVMDEFMDYPASSNWISMMESIPASIGMVMTTFAIWQWHKEQLALNSQWQTREGFVRNTEDLDPVTQLYRGEHWIKRLEQAFNCAPDAHKTLVLLDINDFSQFNSQYGHKEGNRYLRGLASMLSLSLPSSSLVCRFAGDRFAILLIQDVKANTAKCISQLSDSISHFAFYPHQCNRPVCLSARHEAEEINCLADIQALILRLNQYLDEQHDHAA